MNKNIIVSVLIGVITGSGCGYIVTSGHEVVDWARGERTYWQIGKDHCLKGYMTLCGLELSECYKPKSLKPYTRSCVRDVDKRVIDLKIERDGL